MTGFVLAAPAAEPISLVETKAYLRLDGTAEDGLVAALIAAARQHLEATLALALIAQSWRVVLDEWPADGAVALPRAPLLSLTSVTAYDGDGDPQALDLAQFTTRSGLATAELHVPANVSGMPALGELNGIEIDYVAGFGESAAEVPADLRQALLALVAYWFEHREAVASLGTGAFVPAGLQTLLAPYRKVRL